MTPSKAGWMACNRVRERLHVTRNRKAAISAGEVNRTNGGQSFAKLFIAQGNLSRIALDEKSLRFVEVHRNVEHR